MVLTDWKGPFDLPVCIRSGQVFRWTKSGDDPELFEGVDGDNWYRLRWKGDAVEFIDRNATGSFLSLFGLESDPFPELLLRGPELAEAVSLHAGLRLMQPTSPEEVFFCFLCTANNSLHRIFPMCQKLADYGPWLASGFRRFPSPAEIMAISPDELRLARFGYRAGSIPIAAAHVHARGENWLASLKQATYDEARAELMAIHSVGPKLADCVCLYGLGFRESTPIDTHLWQALGRQYFPEWVGVPLSHSRYREAADFLRGRFGDLAGLAQLVLYHENMRRRTA
ncbi:MAG: DNA-3-methyladenine glycosylase family protein [Fimbriimonas sp.]